MVRSFTWLLAIAATACGGDSASTVDASADATVAADGGMHTAAPGFGAIAGPCDRLDGELESASPSLVQTHLDFAADPFDDPQDTAELTDGGRTLLEAGNAGGSSLISEVFAYEVLARCEDAVLLKTETQIGYDPESSKITDMLVDIDGVKIGVSVTRAFVFPPETPYTTALATELLDDKLADILESSANVVTGDAWRKQVLAVLAYGDMHAESIAEAWQSLDTTTRADTIVYVITTDGDDAPLY